MTVTESEWDARVVERQAAANGDPAAWKSLFGWLWTWTVQVAGSEDGAMAGWEKIVMRPSLWLQTLKYFARIFINAGHDVDRMERRHRRRVAALHAALKPVAFRANDAELIRDIKRLFVTLSAEARLIMELYLEGFSVTEIAAITATPQTTVRRHLRTCIDTIRDALGGKARKPHAPVPATQGVQGRLDRKFMEINDGE